MSSDWIATIAEYFRVGLLLGLVEPEEAVAWADRTIACADEPDPAIIEVAWSTGVFSAIDALAAVPGERNKRIAGHWLLGLLRETLPESEAGLELAAQRAMQTARHAELGDETDYRFDVIEDELYLARTNVYGTVKECRAHLLVELAGYPTIHPVFQSDASDA
jgi:hypothetical protein